MSTVTIQSTDFFAYADLAEADGYLLASIDYATWSANDADTKGRFLVSSSRLLDSQSWSSDYDTQAARAVISDIQAASILIANGLSNGDTSLLGTSGTEAEQKRLKVGDLEIENFRSFSGASFTGSNATQFPIAVLALIKPYLSSNVEGSLFGVNSYGTDGASTSDDDYGVTG